MFPFKIKPKQDFINIGDEQSGIIEVAAFDDLTIAEQMEYDEAIAALGNETKPIVDLIIKVSKEKQLSFENAQAVIFGNEEVQLPQGKNAAAIRMEYSSDLLDLNAKALPVQQKKQLIGATIMVRRTIEPLKAYLLELKDKIATAEKSEKEDIASKIAEYEKQLKKIENWSTKDSEQNFRQSTLKVLYEFFLKESNNGVLPKIKEVEKDTIAEEPKSIEEMGKLAAIEIEAQPATNGGKSSGNSKTIGPMTQDSTIKTSRAAPAP